jgi:GNAT superfamily N-acetyltransferase
MIEVTDSPAPDDLAALAAALSAFNDADAGPADRRALAVFLRGETGLEAGLSGYTAWGWLYIQWLWVAQARRGEGLAARMLAAAEAEARARGCHGAWIDTFNPVALRSYERAGYRAFGALADFPPGRNRTFLQKPL